jgi:4-hydroxy-tetrahydrodipicolinate synthase
MGAAPAPFGRTLTAMVTPFTVDGELDVDAAARVASHLVDHGNDGLIVSGTTGESPTTTDEEMGRLLAAVIDAVGDRASVVAGVGTNDTTHSVHLARQAAKHGAAGMLVVTPYYSMPPQAGIVAHMTEVAEAGDLPTMVYDIPGRSGVKLSHDTLIRLAEHPRIVAVKEASGDLTAGSWVLRETDLAFYSGDDALNLAWLAHGAVGIVSVIAHAAPRQCADLVSAMAHDDVAEARRIHGELLPVVRAIMTGTQKGAIRAKAALELRGVLTNRYVRRPLIQLTDSELAVLREDLSGAGLL